MHVLETVRALWPGPPHWRAVAVVHFLACVACVLNLGFVRAMLKYGLCFGTGVGPVCCLNKGCPMASGFTLLVGVHPVRQLKYMIVGMERGHY